MGASWMKNSEGPSSHPVEQCHELIMNRSVGTHREDALDIDNTSPIVFLSLKGDPGNLLDNATILSNNCDRAVEGIHSCNEDLDGLLKFVCAVKHGICRSPACVTVKRNFERPRDTALELAFFEIFDSLTRRLNLDNEGTDGCNHI